MKFRNVLHDVKERKVRLSLSKFNVLVGGLWREKNNLKQHN